MLELLPPSTRLLDQRTSVEFDRPALVSAVAHRERMFIDAGVSSGMRIVLGHGEGVGFIVDLFAAWRLGAVAVVVSPSLTAAERLRVAVATQATLWIGPEATEGVALLPPQTPRPQDKSIHIGRGAIDLDGPALVLMTSGTTSTPKGVVHSHRSLRSRIALNLAHIDSSDLVRSLNVLPMHFGHGLVGNCLTPLAAGAALTLWPEPGMTGFSALGDVIDDHQITFVSSVPAMWRVVLRASSSPRANSIRRVHVGSAPLSVELWQSIARWCNTRRILNMYGATETANWIGGHSLEQGDVADGLVGRPWGGALRVATPHGRLTETGEGEVVVVSPSLMTGYLGQPELTARVVQDGCFFTGDRGVIDAHGRLRLIGRREHEINRAGMKIPAEEIDLLLERHPAVTEACAFALDDPVAGEIVAAAIVPARPGAVCAQDLLNWCQTRIRKEAVPARFYILSALPRSERGKVSRSQVRAVSTGKTSEGAH